MTDTTAGDHLNSVQVKREGGLQVAGGKRITQSNSYDAAAPLTDCVPNEEENLCLDEQILSVLDNPGICSNYLPKCNGKSANSKHCTPAVVSSEEGDENSEEEDSFQGYMPLPQDSDEDPDTYNVGLVMNRPNVGTGLSHQQCDMHQGVLHVESGGAAKPSELGKEEVEEIKEAMSRFSLPASAIPEWAKNISEDVWKAELVQGLNAKQAKKK